ncbi:hypothetical protein DK853_55275, partial [Klebsiella oxytoca]
YLKHLQDFLLERQVIRSENITAIPLDISFSGMNEQAPSAGQRGIKKKLPDREKSAFIISVISNVLLAL